MALGWRARLGVGGASEQGVSLRAVPRYRTPMFHLANRAVLSVSGSDAVDFLQGLVTQDAARLAAGPAFSALLTPQGKILFDFFIAPSRDAEGFLIDVAVGSAADFLKRLKMYRLRAKVDIALEEDLAVGWGGALEGDAFADPRWAEIGARAIAPLSNFSSDGGASYRERRLALGVPECGDDFGSDEMFLTDVNYDALNGVDYGKGCFVGQEVTSRMKRKGEIRRRTLGLSFDGAAPAVGAPVSAGEGRIGEVINAIDGLALALIRMDRLQKAEDGGLPITLEDRPAHVTIPEYL